MNQYYAWNSKQLELNNIKTDFIKLDQDKLVVKETRKLDFSVHWKKGEELTASKNNQPIPWEKVGLKEEELHYLKKKSWVVIDWIQEQAGRVGLELEEIELEWAKIHEKDFILLNPIPNINTTIFTRNNQRVSISQHLLGWIVE